jgi:hypothetical protein
MLNYKLNAQGGFTPAAPASPDAINPEQVLRYHRKAQGRYGGTGTVPSFIRTSILNHSNAKGILQSPEFLFLYYEIKKHGYTDGGINTESKKPFPKKNIRENTGSDQMQ